MNSVLTLSGFLNLKSENYKIIKNHRKMLIMLGYYAE